MKSCPLSTFGMKRIRDRSPVEDLCSMLAALKSREPMKTSDLNHPGNNRALSLYLASWAYRFVPPKGEITAKVRTRAWRGFLSSYFVQRPGHRLAGPPWLRNFMLPGVVLFQATSSPVDCGPAARPHPAPHHHRHSHTPAPANCHEPMVAG